MDMVPAGMAVHEYLLVLSPHEDLWQRIVKIKEEFCEKYQVAFSKHLRPHIPLVRFTQRAMMEERILTRLQAVSMGISPFKVELKDYGSFPSHTLFINVPTKLPIQGLVKQIRTMQALMKMDKDHKPHFMDNPFVLIGQRLKPWQYEQGWLEYSHRQFTARFIAGHMLLLKRRDSGKGSYQVLRRFEFLNLPVTTLQGSLFAQAGQDTGN